MNAIRLGLPTLLGALALLAAGCRTTPVAPPGSTGSFVSGSASADDGWTTPGRPTSIATPVTSPQTWSDSVVNRSSEPAYRIPPPPPPPGSGPVEVVAPSPAPYVAPPTYVAPSPAPQAAPYGPAGARTWSGCGLPCESGCSMWHVRGAIGWAFFEGDDPANDCLYWGLDLGRTFCGCWGLDLFYRYNPGTFDRLVPPGASGVTEDGGVIHHVGAKITYERSFGQSRFYGWGGLGAEYWWTEDYLEDDDGFGLFGEIGVGYVLSQNFRIRAGLNVHWLMDASMGRYDPLDDGEGRDLWVLAPVVELEIDF